MANPSEVRMHDAAPATPREREDRKTRREKHDDWAYTASHAAVCLATDMLTPILSHVLQGEKSSIHSHVEGEIYGDLLGVPATVVVQRFSPETTAAIRAVVEPIMRPVYEKSAEHYAQAWAEDHGEVVGSEAYETHKQRHYEREMDKLPLGILWSVTSMLINTGYQVGKQALSHHADVPITHINEGTPAEILLANLKGAGLTFALTNSARILFPRKIHKLDRFLNNQIAEPVAGVIDFVTGQGTVMPPETKQMNTP
jgi:hypothetical protein